jgi:hypothetical protein|tara:strand:- start:261 stop:449 length:189 start_codon:yes stop_codon:yes gene_type:complete
LKGGKVSSEVGMKIMLYTYCSTFSINPMEAYDTPVSVIKDMLEIHGEIKTLESEAMKEGSKK